MADDRERLIDRAYGVGEHAVTAAPAAPAIVNRRGAILALGVTLIVIGGFFGLMTVGAIVMGMGASPTKGPVALVGLIYAIPTANLLLCGIGSVRIAPWARRATIISAGLWLGLGLIVLLGMAFAIGIKGLGNETAIVGVVMVPMFLIWLGMPVTLIVVYTRPSVRATFEGRAG